jgi:UDP-N-acetylmuramate: L-alanyl-gamma-D-glutamyl-meso-diaminopimelate ligase
MNIHFISIGGAIMHNLAIALHKKGYQVTGSDDEIFEPAKSRLEKYGLLPPKTGWYEDKITSEIDAIILGMHAKDDNPEMKKAMELGLKIYSFPEFMYENNKNKKRIVIAGSHGKTTITAMVMHALSKLGYDFDYMVGSGIAGFDDSVRLSENAPWIVMEGDEYLTSALDKRPKFLWYKPEVALISGIAWDHMNVFPTYEIYVQQFLDFMNSMPENASVVYCNQDSDLVEIVNKCNHLKRIPYGMPEFRLINNKFSLIDGKNLIPLEVFGSHNLMNIEGAALVCRELGIQKEDFFHAISDFRGAGKRLEVMLENDRFIVFRDFAHAPSKVKATIEGIRIQYPDRKVIACLELHTFSSLNKEFLPQYAGSADKADEMFIYINPEEVKLKRLDTLDAEMIKKCFGRKDIKVFFDLDELKANLKLLEYTNSIILMMSSGSYGGWNISYFFSKLS